MKWIFTCLWLPFCAAAQIDTAAPPKAPLLITKGGHYSGSYRSIDAAVAAITISCTDTVWLENVYASGTGDVVHVNGGAKLIINNLRCDGLPPAANRQRGWGLYAYQPQFVRLEHFVLNGTGGLRMDKQAKGGTEITIRYGEIKNTSRLTGNNSVGKGIAPGLQLLHIRDMQHSEISWLYFENEPGWSYVEDNINLYNSGGADKAHPLPVHDVCVNGAYPYPADSAKYSGTGITTDGDGRTAATVPAFINVYHCTFVRTLNAAMNLPIGHDVHYYENTIVNSGKLRDGGAVLPMSWSATCIWNMSHLPNSVFFNNTIENNTIGYYHKGGRGRLTDRQDENAMPLNLMPEGKNRYLPNPITHTMEEDALAAWRKRVKENGLRVGVRYK